MRRLRRISDNIANRGGIAAPVYDGSLSGGITADEAIADSFNLATAFTGATSFSASGLPSGASVNSAGTLSLTNAVADGSYTFDLTATNAGGDTVVNDIPLIVDAQVELAASANTPAAGSATGNLPGSPFAVGQFVTVVSWNSGPTNATMTSPASGFTAVYNNDNGTRAGNIWSIASLASATQTITFNVTRTRSRSVGWSHASEIVDFSVDYGVTPLTPGALDVTGKRRTKAYGRIGGGTNTYTAGAGWTSTEGSNTGTNGDTRAIMDTPVGDVSSWQPAAWTSTDNAQQAISLVIGVQ